MYKIILEGERNSNICLRLFQDIIDWYNINYDDDKTCHLQYLGPTGEKLLVIPAGRELIINLIDRHSFYLKLKLEFSNQESYNLFKLCFDYKDFCTYDGDGKFFHHPDGRALF